MAFFSINRGVTDDMKYDQKRRQQLSNVFYMIAFSACVIGVVDLVMLGMKAEVIILHSFISLIPVTLLYINKYRKFQSFAIDGFFLITNVWIFLNASTYGPSSGMQYFYFPTIIGTFIMIPPKKWIRLIIFSCLTIGCIVTLEITHYSLLLDSSLSESEIRQKYYTMFAVTLFEAILGSWYIVRVADNNEKMLEKEKLELARLNGEMDRLNNYVESQNLQLKDELHQKSLELLQQQKDLNQALIEGEEKERKRLSKELHDGLGLVLSTAKIKLQTIDKDKLEENKTMEDALELIDKACIELRLISQNLTPTMISEVGIEVSLKSIIHSINTSRYIKIELITFDIESVQFKEEMDIQLYRMILELLNNCIKHSFADTITVQLIYGDHKLHIQVEDNGSGIPADSGVGNGLKNIKSTVNIYNGEMAIDSSEGKGTTVMISIPA